MRYRIALCGFSEFEYRAMHFSFQHPPEFQESTYDVVDALSEADFAVVDADSQPAVTGVVSRAGSRNRSSSVPRRRPVPPRTCRGRSTRAASCARSSG